MKLLCYLARCRGTNHQRLSSGSVKITARRPSVVFSAGNHLSWLLASHPLQVRAGYNQLIPLFVTMTDRELFHARRQSTTSGTAPHAVRAWRCPLLYV